MPTSDHVPVEMYAALCDASGTATTAEAVSCDATTAIGVDRDRPVASATCGRRPSTIEPGSTIDGKIRSDRPSRRTSSSAH